MPAVDKIFFEVMSGSKDNNIRFSELQKLLETLGFSCRIKGDHFIYYKNGVDEIINIQPSGNKAKPYQVKQVRNIILKYQMEV
ncbi:MAG: type II toxin-antitoxin system HicA family toxin [Lachnospiraceae bacterium]|nr:type II toxin-antitoxin system HicA family toxin [Lachnospiraceae bacterium]